MSAPAGVGAPAGADAGGAGGSAPGTPSAPQSFYDGAGISPELRAWGESKGYKGEIGEVGKILASYQSLERQLGGSLRIPGADAKPEEIAAFHEKLGRPKSADLYKLEGFKPAEGVDPATDPTIGWFKKTAFEAGLSEMQASRVAASFGEFAAQARAAEEAQRAEKARADEAAVRAKWGAEAPQRERAVFALAQKMGLAQEDIASIVSAWGVEKWAGFASELGLRLLEADHGAMDPVLGPAGSFTMSRESALLKLEELKNPQTDFAKKYLAGDPAAKRQAADLFKLAYPSA